MSRAGWARKAPPRSDEVKVLNEVADPRLELAEANALILRQVLENRPAVVSTFGAGYQQLWEEWAAKVLAERNPGRGVVAQAKLVSKVKALLAALESGLGQDDAELAVRRLLADLNVLS
jgi:hypothetical protein